MEVTEGSQEGLRITTIGEYGDEEESVFEFRYDEENHYWDLNYEYDENERFEVSYS